MSKRLGWLFILLCPLVPLAGQDIDSNPSTHKRSLSTIAGQISDPFERTAFLELFHHAPPQQMLSHAESFLARFPQSAFLAQAYEVAARAGFDLERYELGLRYAEASLALLPENPLLLVAIADVEARLHYNSAAIDHARQALDGIDRFGPPGSVAQQDWPQLQRQLKATAMFSKGRGLLQEALALPAGNERTTLFKDCESSLLEARRLNSGDLEIQYLLGLAQLSSGDASQAAGTFAAVYRAAGPLAPKALENLHTIHQLVYSGTRVPFEVFLRQTEQRSNVDPSPASAQTQHPGRSDSAPAYIGSEACRGCHAEVYQQWSQTGMAKMLRPYAPQNVAGDFTTNNQFYLQDEIESRGGKIEPAAAHDQSPFARMAIRNGRHYFDILQSDGRLHPYPVDYTIGSKFQQAYATKLPNGEIHVFPIQYNLLEKRWINFWKIIDGPGSERADPRSWERLGDSTSYQAICAVCHTSQLRNIKGGSFAPNHLEFREPGIGCEMCHGPSAQHAAEMAGNQHYPKQPLDPPVSFREAGNRDFVAICAQCHMQSAIRTPGSAGELNYSASGIFFTTHLRGPFGEFSRKGFYKDGRFRQTTFMVEALERSQCYKKGQVSCGTCHDPHGHDSASNPASLKFRDQPDRMCTGCHHKFQDGALATRHSHHAARSEASRCVACHMPRIMDALLFQARTHQIDDIPNPAMTKRFGKAESPNACLLCHTKQDANWVQLQLQAWEMPPGTRQADASLLVDRSLPLK